MKRGASNIARRSRLSIAAIVAVGLLAGCGTRLSDDEIVQVASLGGPAAGTTTGVGVPTGTNPGTLGATAPAPGTSVANPASGGSTAPSGNAAGAGAANGPAASAGQTSGAKASAAPGGSAQARKPTVANLSEIRLGSLGPFSGVLGALTKAMPPTLQAWAANLNATGGLNGHPVKVIIGDTQGDPTLSMSLAKRMVETDKVLAMVAPQMYFEFHAIDTYLTQHKVPMIGGDGCDPEWRTSLNAFPIGASCSNQIIAGMRQWVGQGLTKLGMVYCVEVARLCGVLHDDAMKSEVGKYIVQSAQVSLVAPSYTSQCIQMRNAGVQMIHLLLDTAAASRFLQNCATQGYKPKSTLVGLNASGDMTGIPVLQDTMIAAMVLPPGATGVAANDLLNTVVAKYAPAVKLDGFAAMAWASAQLMQLAGSDLSANPTSDELFKKIWTLKNETLGGLTVKLTYGKGVPAKADQCIFISGVKDGKFIAPKGTKPVC